ncbi:MAG TPA: efflux RND transporter periplasmic adaptor subunit [Tepidisphaeraceae bacterium]|nr:efflux RND transporter periplasmic adaptor subunit [Tepidisphaeraceae bacterium]
MSNVAIAASVPGTRRWTGWLIAAVVAMIAVGGYAAYTRWAGDGAGQIVSGDFYNVQPIDLVQHIIKDGELQAVNNIDIICQVEGQSTINTLVKEGTFAKKGDVLVTLDSSAIRQKMDDTTLALQTSEADVTNAREAKEIQESQNDANMDAATVALNLAKLDYAQYVDGTYPQTLANANTDLEMAKITLRNSEEDYANAKSLYAKGFVTGADIQKSELALTNARNGVSKAQTALDVLTKYTHAEDLASKQNAVAQAEKSLMRTKQQNQANLAQKTSDFNAKQEAFKLQQRKMEHLQEQFEDCTIKAPADGMVVYASSGDRNAQNPIQEGATVRERQPLLRLPDTSSMMASIRVPEGSVGSLREGQRAMVNIVNVPRPLPAKVTRISVLVDSGQRWWNPDLKEYPVDLTLDLTPRGLKPGMGCRSEVFIDRIPNALAVPLPAIYASGQDSYVFVRSEETVRPVKVKLGATNETHAQILDGLTAGDQVLVLQAGQGRELLEKNGIKVASPTTKPSRGEKHRKPDDAPTAPTAGDAKPAV